MSDFKIFAYNFNLKFEDDYKEYILTLLQQQFTHFENIATVIVALKSYNESDPGNNYLKSSFILSGEPENSGLSEKYKQAFVKDDEKFLDFYKKSLDDKSILVVTNRHNNLYKSIETRIKGAMVIDYETILNYQKIIKKNNGDTNGIEELVQFERDYLLPKDDWTALIFPYFFLSKFIGVIHVIFKGEFDIEVLGKYIEFLRYAKNTFYVGIVNHIIDDWIAKNPEEDFMELVKYFIELDEMEGMNDLCRSYLNTSSSELSVYTPLIYKKMPLLIEHNSNECFFYIEKTVSFSEQETRNFAFKVISHIQWLRQHWIDKKGTSK